MFKLLFYFLLFSIILFYYSAKNIDIESFDKIMNEIEKNKEQN